MLYNLSRALEETYTGATILVEGFFDCMKVTEAEQVCVALMGCSMSEQQEAQLAEHFNRILIMLDGDDAGRTAVAEITARLARHVFVRTIALGDGKQPDQLSKEEIQRILADL